MAIRSHADFVFTGQLPERELVAELVQEAHERYRTDREGENAQVYPTPAANTRPSTETTQTPNRSRGTRASDADHAFAVMSVSKPFVFALVCEQLGPAQARDLLGVNATGQAFNSLGAVERSRDGRTNPMVNAGAIATTSLAAGDTSDARWSFIHRGLSRFAGRELALDEEVYVSAAETNHRNRSLAWLLAGLGRIYCDPREAVELYTKQCSLQVSARDLAVMGATLPDGGVNPITKEQVVAPRVCHYALAVMLTAGMYKTSGEWLYDVGLPAKSGIGGGGIVTVSPGKGAMGTFAPPLDRAGTSVKGQLVAKFLSPRLGMDLLASAPAS
jgi:glutaminase